jgi:hypothetical protein
VGVVDRWVTRHVRKPARDAVRRASSHWCPECQRRADPFHVCVTKTDFKQRRRQAERVTRRRSRAKGTTQRQAHDYRSCADRRCQRTACIAYREGQAACPLEHV